MIAPLRLLGVLVWLLTGASARRHMHHRKNIVMLSPGESVSSAVNDFRLKQWKRRHKKPM